VTWCTAKGGLLLCPSVQADGGQISLEKAATGGGRATVEFQAKELVAT
jgi:hypothetical protein